MPSLLAATNQVGTLRWVGVTMAVSFMAVVLAPVFLTQQYPAVAIALFAAGAIGLVSCAFYAIRAIRCPACSYRWLEHALGERPMGNWLHWLLTFESCPQCEASRSFHEVKNEAV
jgi:hypothetical protein